MESEHTVATADGIQLRAWLAVPEGDRGSPLATLVLCHGLATDASEHGAFPALRDAALSVGVAVVRFDFRAHGRSGGTNEGLRLAGLRADIEAILSLVDRTIGAQVPIIPLGVSFGGSPAVHAAVTRKPCAGLILWYAVVDHRWNWAPDAPVRFTQLCRSAADPSRDPPWAQMPVVGTSYFFPKAMISEMAEDTAMIELTALELPVLAYQGGRDKFVGAAPLRWLAGERPNVDLRIVPGAGHGFLLWRPWVIRQTISWAVQVAREAPCGDHE